MSRATRNHLTSAVLFWSVMLAIFGGTRRWLDSVLTAAPAGSIALDRPLGTLPLQIGSWEGEDVPVDPVITRVAGTDDHVNRVYRDHRSGAAVTLYVGYTSRPVTMLGHRPDVCYPANGWLLVETRKEEVALADRIAVPVLVHEFRRETPHSEALVVMNYYILQGRRTTEWTDFWGPKWRRPNLSRDPSYYVAQVQVSAGALIPSMADRAKTAARRFVAAAAGEIEVMLPLTPSGRADPP